MRPEDRRAGMAGFEPNAEMLPPIDADLLPLHDELAAAGSQARRALQGRTQPTRVFSSTLRDRLVGAVATPAAAAFGPGVAPAAVHVSGAASRVRPGITPGEAWAPRPLQPHLGRRTPTVLPRARWSLLAAAALAGVLVAGVMGARLDWLIPSPTAGPTGPATSSPETAEPTLAAVVALPTSAPTTEPSGTSPASEPPATAPTPMPTKKPAKTPMPEPTAPPIVPMELAVKACPGGVVLDWTKPSPAVHHYRVLRSLDGDVAPTYPAPGGTDVESATSWSAGVTDGYDASLDGGGSSAAYRVFAFDATNHVMAFSPTATVTTIAALSLGSLETVDNGDGSMTVSWAASDLPDGCFTYGKLVASTEDPDPSYLKGSPYVAVIGDAGTTSVTIDAVSSGTWIRYEIIRGTGTGKFVVARTTVLQYP